jgi:hypothetical protein
MNGLLWLVNHSLWGNAAGIWTSWNPDTTNELKSRLSVGIGWILVELPHSTKPKPGKLHRSRMDSGRASTLEQVRGLPTSQENLQPQNLTSLSTLQEWTWEHYREIHITFLTPSADRSRRVLLVVLKPNRIIHKHTDANCSSFHLWVFLRLSNPRDRGRLALYLYRVITLVKEKLCFT